MLHRCKDPPLLLETTSNRFVVGARSGVSASAARATGAETVRGSTGLDEGSSVAELGTALYEILLQEDGLGTDVLGRVTGMMLQMPPGELLQCLSKPKLRMDCVLKCLHVLKSEAQKVWSIS